jgi:hypothetical protein
MLKLLERQEDLRLELAELIESRIQELQRVGPSERFSAVHMALPAVSDEADDAVVTDHGPGGGESK